ncbi:MAG TPA: aldehyde dehydrogenase family protein [Ktedonobacteraceae bacterium]|nr:aldehyde dehydrogenase family protein [Ktedonobacteraceae bacterium]
MYSGQACESGTRLLLPDSLHDQFVERMIERARTIKIGDPFDAETDLGPVISHKQREQVMGYIELGQKEGATLALLAESLGARRSQSHQIGSTHPLLCQCALPSRCTRLSVADQELLNGDCHAPT